MTRSRQPPGSLDPTAPPADLDLALLQAAKDGPEDDTPRLVLADWLQEHDQPQRGEFVRLQCRLGPAAPALFPEQRLALEARCQRLLDLYGGAWLGPLWRWWPAPLAWHRGLLSVRAPRRFRPEPLLEMAAWLDTLLVEVGGKRSLGRALAVVAHTEVNHVCLDLRTPFSEAALLRGLAGLAESPCGTRPPGQPGDALDVVLALTVAEGLTFDDQGEGP